MSDFTARKTELGDVVGCSICLAEHEGLETADWGELKADGSRRPICEYCAHTYSQMEARAAVAACMHVLERRLRGSEKP